MYHMSLDDKIALNKDKMITIVKNAETAMGGLMNKYNNTSTWNHGTAAETDIQTALTSNW